MAVKIFDQARQIEQLSTAISMVLHGHGPVVQSAVIADLLAKYLAGWPSEHRDERLARILELASELVGPNEKIIAATLAAAGERLC